MPTSKTITRLESGRELPPWKVPRGFPRSELVMLGGRVWPSLHKAVKVYTAKKKMTVEDMLSLAVYLLLDDKERQEFIADREEECAAA